MANEMEDVALLILLNKQELELEAAKAKAAAPTLTDLEYIPVIFDWFCELVDPKRIKQKLSTEQKREFIYIILLLYCKSALAIGGKMIKDLRQKLAQVLGYEAPSGISNLCPGLLLWFNRYKNYNKEVIEYFAEIKIRLREKGMIKDC